MFSSRSKSVFEHIWHIVFCNFPVLHQLSPHTNALSYKSLLLLLLLLFFKFQDRVLLHSLGWFWTYDYSLICPRTGAKSCAKRARLHFASALFPLYRWDEWPEQPSEREALQPAKDSCCVPKSELNLDDAEVILEASKWEAGGETSPAGLEDTGAGL